MESEWFFLNRSVLKQLSRANFLLLREFRLSKRKLAVLRGKRSALRSQVFVLPGVGLAPRYFGLPGFVLPDLGQQGFGLPGLSLRYFVLRIFRSSVLCLTVLHSSVFATSITL